ncbi:hypothetical protein A2Z00_02790 [Candidatus Gottesmanbacteria bacterium RBG_13_45_10]|uniref:DUF6922 domain-containing protein n=1 Tax=Candidatus Gottesmanbacteria bacterium RBG_13_45_10 TaxID=1798370 RepID=A0A1F5ZHE2_9BACT|nr:MAG: hypothetical protein A2Z00_02790 [Candidatus Gottesmanbacteria bacterium RBG_13_45_10]
MTLQQPSSFPEFLTKYVWDIDVARLDIREKPPWLAARILDKGDEPAVHWLRQNYTSEEIRGVLKTSRDLSLRSASFWALIYGVPRSEVRCFQEPYLSQRKTLWPY